MKEEILTAKEWLEKEGIYTSIAKGIDIGIIVERGIINSELMERYANYKNKMLEDTYDEYIKLLSSELDKVAGLQITHPHLVEVYTEDSEVIVKGKELREQILKLKVK